MKRDQIRDHLVLNQEQRLNGRYHERLLGVKWCGDDFHGLSKSLVHRYVHLIVA